MSEDERQSLFANMQYLNIEEIRDFCRRHELHERIHIELPGGRLKATRDRDRKDIVLARILAFAVDGERTGPTIYSHKVVSSFPLPEKLTSRTRVHYGQYEKKNQRFVDIMKRLTGGEFRTGMIARLVLRDFWQAGRAPTLRQFADMWVRATRAHTSPRPEGAYLADLSRGTAGSDWKELRNQKARNAVVELNRLVSGRE